jgi:hypothetical protein
LPADLLFNIIEFAFATGRSMPARFFEQEDRSPDDMRLSRRVALVVGNGGYPHARLPNARNDARLVASALEAVGFSTEVLIDAGKTALETAIVRLGERMERAGGGAFGFFYFAGHGIQYEGMNFILPVDADLPDVRYLRSGAVPVDLVIEEIDRGGEAAVVALDACRDNRIPNRSGGPLRGLASMRRVPPGTIVAFATAADQVADDGATGNSPFAISLSQRMVEPGRRLDEIFFMVARDVAAATRGAQQPSLFVQGALAPIVLHGDAAAVAEVQDQLEKSEAVITRSDPPANRSTVGPAAIEKLSVLDLKTEPQRTKQSLFQQSWARVGAAIAAVLVLLGGGAGMLAWRMWPPAHATGILVVNDSRMRIDRLYASHEGHWGEDRLGKGTLPAGLGMRVQLKGDSGCRFNIKVVYANDREETRNGVDLCTNPEVVFRGP